MNIAEMNREELEARKAEILTEMNDATEERLKELREEANQIATRKAELDDIEKRKAEAKSIQNGDADAKIIEKREEKKMEEKKVFGVESKEYRDAFYAMIAGKELTEEQRSIVVDNTAPGNGDAIAIPKTLDEKIWDGIHTAHPILADIAYVRSGMALEVTKHTSNSKTTKKLDKDANAGEEENTFVKVVLFGYDYEKYVEMSYAEAKMSQGALEDYLAQEISAEIGEALAKDVFTQILADAGNGQKVAKATVTDTFDQVKAALALAKLGGKKTIYAPSTRYYDIVGAIKSGSPFNIGATLGCEVKLDDAASDIVVLAPKSFVLNEVQGVMVESQRDVKSHKIVVSGYMRAQGTLRHNTAAAYVG